jgi:hypothetical protein
MFAGADDVAVGRLNLTRVRNAALNSRIVRYVLRVNTPSEFRNMEERTPIGKEISVCV